MNRKGLFAFDVVYAVIWLFFLVVVGLVMFAMINITARTSVDIREVETDALAYKFLYSYNGFNYKNVDIQRSYPGYIDDTKFNNNTIKRFFDFEEEIMAAKLVLKNLEDGKEAEVYFNKAWFERWKPLAMTKLPGPGGAKMSSKNLPVIITDNKFDKKEQGVLTIEIVTPNS